MGSIHEIDPLVVKDERPLGIRVIENSKKRSLSYHTYQAIVLTVTFLSYTTYHLTRKTTSIVKSALDPQTPSATSMDLKSYPWQSNYLNLPSHGNNTLLGVSDGGWAPFNGSDGTKLLGYLDVAFLGVYAAGMFFSGHIGDRMNLRVFLTIGMLGTGLFTALFGFGYWFNIHNFYYYLIIQMLAGVLQSTGWPSVVAVVGNWFGKGGRGLIMGVWNAHTSVGNIAGSLIASSLLKYGWGWSLVVPGLTITLSGIIVFFFLPVSPLSCGMHMGDDDPSSPRKEALAEPFIPFSDSINESDEEEHGAVGFIEAWRIPGVANYALCLFFAKLVAYTFLYWLPFYISSTEIGGEYLSSETAGNLSTFFDIGGVIGGILAGFFSDKLDARAITAASFTYFIIPALYLYRNYGFLNLYLNIVLMFVTGMFVNGPYALITTAVSADLGTHESLKGNSRALATVTAIIDGTGSIGAAVGPLLTGYISSISWDAVFTMLMTAALIAGLLLTKLVIEEVRIKIDGTRIQRPNVSRDLV